MLKYLNQKVSIELAMIYTFSTINEDFFGESCMKCLWDFEIKDIQNKQKQSYLVQKQMNIKQLICDIPIVFCFEIIENRVFYLLSDFFHRFCFFEISKIVL